MGTGADQRIRPREWLAVSAVSAAVSLALLLHHLRPGVETMLTHGPIRGRPYMVVALELHNELEDFYRRRATTLAVEGVHEVLGLGLNEAFALVSFGLLALAGVALYGLVRQLTPQEGAAWLAVGLFYTSFSTVFLFFVPVFGWDDPMQYVVTFAALAWLVRALRTGGAGDWLGYVVLFSCALVVRESGVFLLPGLVLLSWPQQSSLRITPGAVRRAALVGLPSLVYLGYRFALSWWGQSSFEYETAPRFGHFVSNFLASPEEFSVSVMSLVLVLLPPCYLVWVTRASIPRRVLQALWLTVAINTVVVVTITYAREARLFALALLLVWPYAAVYGWAALRESLGRWSGGPGVLGARLAWGLAAFTVVNALVAFVWFRPRGSYYQSYAFLALEVVAAVICLRWALGDGPRRVSRIGAQSERARAGAGRRVVQDR